MSAGGSRSGEQDSLLNHMPLLSGDIRKATSGTAPPGDTRGDPTLLASDTIRSFKGLEFPDLPPSVKGSTLMSPGGQFLMSPDGKAFVTTAASSKSHTPLQIGWGLGSRS
jgi:hypothetical protein